VYVYLCAYACVYILLDRDERTGEALLWGLLFSVGTVGIVGNYIYILFYSEVGSAGQSYKLYVISH
jgi:hypothetical protein